jgi:hypothetical protein
MSFLRQLFGRRRTTAEQKLRRSNRKTLVTATDYDNDDKEREQEKKDDFFEYIIGYNDIKKFLRMSINTQEPIHILLIGPPASAKTMFIKSMMMKLNNSYFTDGGNSTKAGMLDYIFDNNHISERTGKRIPLDIETNEPHDCPARNLAGRPMTRHSPDQQHLSP